MILNRKKTAGGVHHEITHRHFAACNKRGQTGQVDKSLRTYADFVNKEYQLALKHSQRK